MGDFYREIKRKRERKNPKFSATIAIMLIDLYRVYSPVILMFEHVPELENSL